MTNSLTNSRADAAELSNLFDHAGPAERSLPPAVLDRIAEGLPRRGMDERSRHVLNSIMLRPRVLSDVSDCATDRDVVGGHIQLPVIGGGAFYGLAAGGEEGVYRTLELLRAELSEALRAIGRRSTAQITEDDVRLLQRAAVHRPADPGTVIS